MNVRPPTDRPTSFVVPGPTFVHLQKQQAPEETLAERRNEITAAEQAASSLLLLKHETQSHKTHTPRVLLSALLGEEEARGEGSEDSPVILSSGTHTETEKKIAFS